MSVTLQRMKTPHERLSEIVGNLEVRGAYAQIGLGTGESARTILQSTPLDKKLVIVDPYGSMGYRMMDDDKLGYPSIKVSRDNNVQIEILAGLYKLALESQKHFLFYPMEDIEFYQRFQTGIFYYDEGEQIRTNEYGFVYFNAENCIGDLIEGIRFMDERTPKDGVWVFNNINDYNTRQQELLDELMEEANMDAQWESDFLVATKTIEPSDCLKPKQEAYAEDNETLTADVSTDPSITYH